MKVARLLPVAIAWTLSCALAFAQQPAGASLTAEAVMARVAAHQDSSEADRVHYVYIQHARVVSHKGKRILCEETTDSRVTPTEKASQQQLLKLNGRFLQKNAYIAYTEPPAKKPGTENNVSVDSGHVTVVIDDSTDIDLVENMRDNLTNSKSTDSKDGFFANLFPLTTKEQANEDFKLLGRETVSGRDVFHITFTPKDKSDYGWKGDAFIDTVAFQPVLVRTTMSRNIPFAVRTLLGTNVPGLGFTITYAPQPDGVWFPVSFGTEFKIKVLFFFSREISVSAQNRDFEKTHVTSHIVGDVATSETPSDKPPQN